MYVFALAVMTFGSFRDYKLKLLWESWDIQEEWQFALSWLAVFLAVVLYHALHFVIYSLEAVMREKNTDLALAPPRPRKASDGDIELGSSSTDALTANEHHDSNLLESSNRHIHKVEFSDDSKIRIAHAILGGISYGLAMLLMLVAMTYNPSLLLALIFGYAVGDFIFFRLSGSSPDSGCH
jgi:hypothetical protein